MYRFRKPERLYYGLLLFIAVAAACKKTDKGAAPAIAVPVSFRIKTAEYRRPPSYVTRYVIGYDGKGRVDSIATLDNMSSNGTGYTKFTYADSVCTIHYHFPGDTGLATLISDSRGVVSKIIKGNARGADTFLFFYDHDTEVVKTETRINNYGLASSSTISWTNGDIDQYSYDTAKWQQGDYIGIEDFLKYGKTIIRTKHLADGDKSLIPLALHTVKYVYDSLGRIVQEFQLSGSDTTGYRYTY